MKIFNKDCIKYMEETIDEKVDMTFTDIPYNEVNRKSNGLRNLDKENADILTFDLEYFLELVWKKTNGTIIIFCGQEQFSTIREFFTKKKGTTRPLVWEKTNPSPMNGQHIYLSGVELAVWFKKPNATFNAHCKSNVFRHSNGTRKKHPTEKNRKLVRELILDNTNEGQTIFDPCFGGGSILVEAHKLNREIIGCEIDEKYYLGVLKELYF